MSKDSPKNLGARLAAWIGKKVRRLRNFYNTYEKIFELLGGLLGIGLFISMFVLGIAGIPLTAGAGSVFWGIYFCCKFLNCYIVMGRAYGIILEYLTTGKKLPNRNEQFFTMLGFVFSCIVAVTLTVLLAIFADPIVITLTAIDHVLSPWIVCLIEVPCIIGTITGFFRHVGRIWDRCHKETPAEWASEKVFGPAPGANADGPLLRNEPELSEDKKITDKNIQHILEQAINGINIYKTERKGQLGFFSDHFDYKTGKRRANAYLEMFSLAVNNFCDLEIPSHDNTENICVPAKTHLHELREVYDKLPENNENNQRKEEIQEAIQKDNEAFYLQQAVILYTLIQNDEGDKLKASILNTVGYQSVDQFEQALRLYIQPQIPAKATRENIRDNVIEKLGLFANTGERLISKKPEKNKDIGNRVKSRYRTTFADITTSLGNLRKVQPVHTSANINTI